MLVRPAASARCAALAPLLLFALLSLGALGPQRAAATTYTVSSSNVADLDSAVAEAMSGDTIAITGTYKLDKTLQPHSGVTLQGAGTTSAILDGNSKLQILSVGSGVTLTVSDLTLQNGRARSNVMEATAYGGGLYNRGTVSLTDCTLTGNSAQYSDPNGGIGIDEGGGLYNDNGGTATLTGCTLTGNSAGFFGGAIENNGTATLTSCTLSGNSTGDGGGAIENNGPATLTGCTLSGNSASGGYGGGGLSNESGGTATLTGCTLSGNSAPGDGGGGGLCNNQGTTTLTRCVLVGNSAESYLGGGINNVGGMATLTGCVFAGNSGVQGGGVSNGYGGTATLTGCTLSGNSAPGDGGGVLTFSDNGKPSTVTLTDDILWNNVGGEVSKESGTATVTYSDIQGGYSGTGNINADPQFVTPYTDSTAPFDLHVKPGSPCVAAGTTNVPAGVDNSHDITGTTRANPPTIGAYEGAVAATATSVVLTGGANPTSYGQPLTFTATVTDKTMGGVSPPTGAVTFTYTPHGGSAVTDGPVTLDGSGQAADGPVLTPGSYTITATYTPASGAFVGSADATLQETVQQATPTVMVFSDNPSSVYGQSVRFTINVQGRGGAAPTGTVNLSGLGNLPGTQNLPLDGSGTATFTTSALTAGRYRVMAQYDPNGDPNYRPADSNASLQTQTVTADRTEVQLMQVPRGQVTYGQGVSFTATVSNNDSGLAPTGAVSFSYTPAGSSAPVAIGNSVTLAAGGQGQSMATSGSVTLPGGRYTITATYTPDRTDEYQGGMATLLETVNAATPVVTVTDNGPNPSVYGQTVTVTVTVAPPAGSTGLATPAGSVTLQGFPSRLTLDGSGQATFTSSALSVGMHSLTANYDPRTDLSDPSTADPDYVQATSPAPQVTQTVNKAMVTAASVAWGSRTASLTAGSSLLPVGRTTDVPWLGISSFTLTLSAPEALAASDVSVTGGTVANYGPVTVSGSGTSYTVTLARPVSAADRVTLTLGNANLTTFTGTLPVLPGDVSDDGVVNASDMVLDRNAIGTSNVFADINGDGSVNVTDYNLVRALIGTRLP